MADPEWKVNIFLVAVVSIAAAFVFEIVTGYTTVGYTTEEPFTQCMDHVGIPSKIPNASQQNLMKFGVVPHYITDIPEFAAEVTWKTGEKADFGNIINADQVTKVPQVTWPEAADDEYYTLFMIDPDVHQKVVPEESYQYIIWLVANIPGSQVSKGEIIVHYQLPKLQEEYHRFHRVILIVHYQLEGARNFSEPLLRKKPMEFRNSLFIANFTRKYRLHGPVAANFIRLHIPMDDTIS